MTLLETKQVEPGRYICTPHPVTLDGQTNTLCDLIPGESLYTFLSRHVDLSDQWHVTIGGVVVPVEHWMRVKPKNGQLIEVRGAVNKQVLYIVAMIALTYFTFGIGTAAGWGAGAAAGAFGAGTLASAVFAGVVFAAGSVLINKALGPKVGGGSAQSQPDSVYNLGAARNRPRPYEPFPLLFGSRQITPDLASNPYTRYQGNDQFVSFVLNAGINVDRIDTLSNGDTLLSSYDEVTTYTSGFPGMPEQDIPQYTNADTTSGGELAWEGDWVERTTSPDTVRIELGIEYILYDNDNDGKPYYNQETVVAEYRPAGTTTWLSFQTRLYRHNKPDTMRSGLVRDVPKGQYDVRVHRLGRAGKEKGAFSQFQWTTLVSVQVDEADYSGLGLIGVDAKATGQLNGPMDEVRGVAHAAAMPIWDGAWQTATTRANGLSNPGAQTLAYARGFYDENGRLIAGMGLADEQIDIDALKAFMLHCTAEGYTYDNYVQSVRSHDDMLNAIALAGFGQITWAGGRLSVTWAADEQPLSGVVNMATIKKGQFQVDYTLANAADGIEYTYFDRETWQPQTLRVAAPGVTVMLNPATLTGEGVTTEAHAAQLARYHLGQHLYQYKDISYSTDLEHLSYRRLSVLALQHDLTKWGKGGRLMAAVDNGTVTLTLDEPVPAPAAGNAYIGLRIPGENVYRIFTVASFEGESDTITLTEEWPVDAALPGDDDANPAHDTIWIYDFQQTPGYRVRVVGIEPESGLKGASVAVVPEPPEFWTYVKTGEYTPPVVNPMLPARPTVSGLQVTETKTVQGDTVYTELSVTFDVTGPMAYASIHAAYYVDSDSGYEELREVAQTQTRTAKFRIGAAGSYAIVVRPYDANGIVGGVASTTYTTIGADIAPTELDYFTVAELDGGVRKYAFGYFETTIKPPDYAGSEIRYITGNVPDPDWAAMTPLGADGFFTSAVEMVMPPAGLWTFAARPRSTGKLLGPLSILTLTLTENLGEIGQQTGAELAAIIQAQLEAAQDLADEIIARQQAIAGLDGAFGAPEYDPELEYVTDYLVRAEGGLYRATQAVPLDTPPPNPTYWHSLGTIASLPDRLDTQALAVSNLSSEVTDLDGEVGTLSGALTVVQGQIAGKASTASVTALDQEITQVDGRVTANAAALTQVETEIGEQSASITEIMQVAGSAMTSNGVSDPSFENGSAEWGGDAAGDGSGSLPAGVAIQTNSAAVRSGSKSISFASTAADIFNTGYMPAVPGQPVMLGFWARTGGTTNGTVQPTIQCYNAAGTRILYTGALGISLPAGSHNDFRQAKGLFTPPAGTAFMRMGVRSNATVGNWIVDDCFMTPLTNTDVEFLASYTLTLDVNGRITGYRIANDGTTGSFDVLADQFRIIAPGSGQRTEFSNGNWRVYDAAGTLRVQLGVF